MEGRVLLLDPVYKDGLILPGGSAEANEPPHKAAIRHLHAETGLTRHITHTLTVDWVPADRYPEGLNIIFDGGLIAERDKPYITVPPVEVSGLRGHRWAAMNELHSLMQPDQARRVEAALNSKLSQRSSPVLVGGRPVR